jgi:flavin-dependent dehydrogenase
MRQLACLPDGPELSDAEQVSKLVGKLEMPNVIRPAARPGIAFVGDAALAADPAFGVGIGFAFQSAEWLVDETSAVLGSRPELDDALRRYRRRLAWRLGPHHLQMADFSTRRKFRPLERLALRRATADPVLARAFGEVLMRERSPLRLFDPRIAARLIIPA